MPRVKENPALGRFEMGSGDSTAFLEYRRAGDRIALLHTEVPEALSGQGVGSKLVRGPRDAARAEGLKVVPRCEFVAACVARQPEYRHPPGDAGRGGAQLGVGPPSEASLRFTPARALCIGSVSRGSMARPTAQASSAER